MIAHVAGSTLGGQAGLQGRRSVGRGSSLAVGGQSCVSRKDFQSLGVGLPSASMTCFWICAVKAWKSIAWMNNLGWRFKFFHQPTACSHPRGRLRKSLLKLEGLKRGKDLQSHPNKHSNLGKQCKTTLRTTWNHFSVMFFSSNVLHIHRPSHGVATEMPSPWRKSAHQGQHLWFGAQGIRDH